MYGKNWDQYYQRTYKELKKKALWDVPVEEAVVKDLELFKPYFSKDISLIDLGCGTGTQTAFLARHYDRVLGVDVSAEAISVARQTYTETEQMSFDVLDVTDILKGNEIAQRMGGANIYMRGVLHQIKEVDIPAFQQNLSNLLGEEGHLYCIEVSDRIREYFDQSEGNFSELPRRMQQVFISNLPPKGLSLKNIRTYFPNEQFEIVHSGESKLNTNIRFAGKEPIYIPAIFAIVKPV